MHLLISILPMKFSEVNNFLSWVLRCARTVPRSVMLFVAQSVLKYYSTNSPNA